MALETNKLVYGGSMMILISSGATKLPCAFSTSAKLSISTTTVDTTSKDDGDWVSKKAVRFAWNASTDGLTNFALTGSTNSVEDLFAYQKAKLPVNVVFASVTGTKPFHTLDTNKKYFSGTGIISSLEISADDNGMSTYSISIEGTGELIIT